MSITRKILASVLVAIAATSLVAPAEAARPGSMGRMWNPLRDLDFSLMGGVKVGGMSLIKPPSKLGEPPNHNVDVVCSCKNGLKSGFGFGLTFWMPSYINDVNRAAGCLGFMNGMCPLPGFVSLSSSQSYSDHKPRKESTTNMQVHWAYADVTAIAGKSLFEKCDAVTGGMKLAYMTELDFVWANDTWAAIASPHVALLAKNPWLSQMACGIESIANTLGDWRDIGVCAWNGVRLPMSGTTISKNMAQVTNMDITIKYLTRSALLGTTMRTMGKDATCKPHYQPFYDPFQHRYQWSFPGKTSTRFNVDVMRWGQWLRDDGQSGFMQLSNEAAAARGIDPTIDVAKYNSMGPQEPDARKPATAESLAYARAIIAKLPKPLNFPSHEAGYMQVWEARQCCLMVMTIQSVIQWIIENLATMGSATIAEIYKYVTMATTAYQVVKDPIGAALGGIGGAITNTLGNLSSGVATGIKNSLTALTQ